MAPGVPVPPPARSRASTSLGTVAPSSWGKAGWQWGSQEAGDAFNNNDIKMGEKPFRSWHRVLQPHPGSRAVPVPSPRLGPSAPARYLAPVAGARRAWSDTEENQTE